MSDMAKVWFVTICAVVACALLFESNLREDHEWEVFRVAHHCQVEGRIDGASGFRTWAPTKTLWRCDDGLIYGKNE